MDLDNTQFDVQFTIKEVTPEGTFTGYASVFDVVDSDRDVIAKGAFTKALKKGPRKIKMLWQHNRQEIIGVWEEIVEDAKGLLVKGRLLLDIQKGREAYTLMKAGALDSMSVGFAIPAKGYTIDEQKRVRIINEADLWEISLVTFPANNKATVRTVKTVTPFQDLPMADRGRAWDATAAIGRVRQWAGGGTNLAEMGWEKYRQAFVWYSADDPEKVESYKLPIGDIIAGELTVVPRAVFAAAGALLGARGGVDIPDADRNRVTSHLERYYSKMDMESPFKALDMGDGELKSAIHAMLAACETPRDFEQTLRDVGFSQKQAKTIASTIVPPQREVEEPEANSVLEALRKANATLSTSK